MKLTPRTMKLLGSSAIVLSLAGGYFLVVNPFLAEQGVAAQEIQDAEANVERLEGELSRVTLVRDGIAEVQAVDAEISRAFPSASQIPQFTNDVLAAAQRAGLSPDAVTSVTAEVPTLVAPTLPTGTGTEGEATDSADPAADPATDPAADPTDPATQTDPTATAAQPSLAEMSVSIAATGTPEQLAAFLRELGNMERAYLISNSTLAGEPGETGSLAVSGKTFLYRSVQFPTEETAAGEVPAEGDTSVEGDTQP